MRSSGRVFLPLCGVLVLVGCSSSVDDVSDEGRGDGLPVPSVTVSAERLTPFCMAMIDLADELESDPPDDVGATILEVYLDIVDEVPAEIEPEFLAVIAELQGAAPPATTAPITDTTPGATSADTTEPVASAGSTPDGSTPVSVVATADAVIDFDAEGRLPGDTPTERVSDYVLFACRDSDNNPGPPATQPLDDVELEE